MTLPWRGSNAGVLLGVDSPGRLHDRRDSILSLIRSLREQVPGQFSGQGSGPFRTHLFADGSSNISILGERGSGKTTLLFAICAELIDEGRDLVLPPMRPELFSPNESVISAFLASLWSWFRTEADERAEPQKEDRHLVDLLSDSARSFAAATTSREALAHATDSTVDYAEDAVAISRSGARLPSQLADLTRLICMKDEERPRQVVVPVDDPDLAPDKVVTILRSLRVLGSIPGVVPIASFCRDDLAQAWQGNQIAERPAANATLARLFEREMEKLFPYRTRFEIQPLEAPERVGFRPVGETETLQDQFTRLRAAFEKPGTRWGVDETLTKTPRRFGLPNPLPSNARALVQLWTTLEQLRAGEDQSPADHEQILRHTCALLSEPLRMSLDLPPGASFYRIEARDDSSCDVQSVIEMDLEGVQLYVTLGSQWANSVDSGQSCSIALRRILRVKGSRTVQVDGADKRQMLGPEAVASLLAFNEIALGSGRFLLEGEGIWELGEREWVGGQDVTVGGLPTDDRFVRLPSAATFGEVVETLDAWNALVEKAEAGLSIEDLLGEAIVTTLGMVGEEVPSDDLSYRDLFKLATQVYIARRERIDRASQRYCQWYEGDLPMQWHESFFTGETLRNYCTTFRHATEPAFERDEMDVSYIGPRTVVESRLKFILEAVTDREEEARYCWIAGYFELAVAIESAHLEKLSSLSKIWRARLVSLQAGSSSARQLVTRAGGRGKLAPFDTPEGHELFLAARAFLRARATAASRKASQRGY